MQTMSAALAPVVFEDNDTSCPGFPTRSFVCCGPPQRNIYFFIWPHIDFLFLELLVLAQWRQHTHINEEQHVVHPYRNDGGVALTGTLGRMKDNTNIYFLFVALPAQPTNPHNDKWSSAATCFYTLGNKSTTFILYRLNYIVKSTCVWHSYETWQLRCYYCNHHYKISRSLLSVISSMFLKTILLFLLVSLDFN